MNTEYNPMDPALEQAMSEITDEALDVAVIEAAAARVWANVMAQAVVAQGGAGQAVVAQTVVVQGVANQIVNGQTPDAGHVTLRTCEDFQAQIADFKSGRLPAARAMLVKDHLHECVACRRVYEGRVVAMPVQAAPRRVNYTARWAVAAAVVAAAGLSVWVAVDQFGNRTGHAIVQTVNGTLYEILPTGIQVLAVGQELPDGIEIRTAKDSDAMLQLKDGSTVELRERSGFSTTQTASDLTIRLERGSVIVQAAKRKSACMSLPRIAVWR